MIRRLAREVSILLIEHDIGLVMNLSDHVSVMHQGQRLSERTPAAVRAVEPPLHMKAGAMSGFLEL